MPRRHWKDTQDHSDQFSLSVMSDSLQPHGQQHTRLPCPSPTPRVYPNSCPSQNHRTLFINRVLADIIKLRGGHTRVIQFSSVTQSCPTLCNTMNRRTPGFPVHHQLLELAQTPVHQVGDAIQPSHPRSSPSPPAFNLSQHQGRFK